MTIPPVDRVVYGPVRSGRLGVSLGVNLLPAGMKVCNMDCAYCQYGWSRGVSRYRGQGPGWPAVDNVITAVAARLEEASERDEWIDRLTIAGHGEPTLHPEFGAIVAGLCDVRDRLAPRLPIAILSNSTTVLWPDVRTPLMRLDERYMKLDAGEPVMFARLNGGRTSLRAIIDGLRTLTPVTVQSLFVHDRDETMDNASEAAVDHWLWALEAARADRVHIYTLDRRPALGTLRPVPPRRLREIAGHVRAMGIPAEAFVADGEAIVTRASRNDPDGTTGIGA